MAPIVTRVNDYLIRKLWHVDLKSVGKINAFAIKFLRLIYLFVAEFLEEQLALRAMSLVYTTLLSIVPLLAVSFSLLKAFGVHTKLLILLYYFLEPLGEKGTDIAMTVIGFVENVKVSVIGSIGLVTLLYTVMSMIQKIEGALNYIWNVQNTRGFTQKFVNYMSMLLVAPVLIFSITGAVISVTNLAFMKSLAKTEAFGTVIYLAGKFLPYVIVSAAFTFIYIALPNTRVRFKPALTGGFFAGLLWVALGQTFTVLVASPAKYSAIYAGFAALLLCLIWLYWNFFILLVGAKVAYFSQYPQLMTVGREPLRLNNRLTERLAMIIMFLIGYNFHNNLHPWKLESLSERLALPEETIRTVIEAFEKRGIVVASGDEPPAFFPARDIGGITAGEIVEAMRGSWQDIRFSFDKSLPIAKVDDVINKMEAAAAGSVDQLSIETLVLSHKGD